jgi:hypothetical protein
VCETVPVNGNCPEGFYLSNGVCVRSVAVKCPADQSEEFGELLQQCNALGGAFTSGPGQCPEPPPPTEECCLTCEIPKPPEGCPPGFFEGSKEGFCQRYYPTDCSDEQRTEAYSQCSAAGGVIENETVGQCPEPPPPCVPGEKRCNDWQTDIDADGNVFCVRTCCFIGANCACGELFTEISYDPTVCPPPPAPHDCSAKDNVTFWWLMGSGGQCQCAGGGGWMFVSSYCREGYSPAPSPGTGSPNTMHCVPCVQSKENPLP